MVACGPDRGTALIEEAPCLVTEVLSPSTSSIDRREKLLTYRRMESVQAYLVVAQDQRRVDRHWRDERGEWRFEVVEDAGEVKIECPVTTLTLEAIYEGTGM
jgi:Uma2 family endonuclease